MSLPSLPPIVVVEEHHEAYYAWKWAQSKEIINSEKNSLLHIDEHSDMSSPVLNVPINGINGNLELRKGFTYSELNIASFIVPAIYEKLIDKVFWIKQRHNKTNSRAINLYVRSYNNDGKKLITGRKSLLKKFDGSSSLLSKDLISYGFFKQHIENMGKMKDVLLDIDLDYFSCVQDPLKRHLKIEITEEEYTNFTKTPYHRIRYFDLGRVEARREQGRYFYYLNRFNSSYVSPLKVDKATILKRLDFTAKMLLEKKIRPQMITICRSRFSGYTPSDQWRYIEGELTKRLSSIYGNIRPKHISTL